MALFIVILVIGICLLIFNAFRLKKANDKKDRDSAIFTICGSIIMIALGILGLYLHVQLSC